MFGKPFSKTVITVIVIAGCRFSGEFFTHADFADNADFSFLLL